MDFELLGWPPDGPTLRLDYERFSYAGKFVMSNTGKAIAREDETIIAAVAFNQDRTDAATLWIRYLTVRRDHRGQAIGPRLVRFLVDRASDRSYETVSIAVNNPFAYEALYKAGFGYTGEQTGIAELRLSWPDDRDRESYQIGLEVFRNRDVSTLEQQFLEKRLESSPPPVVSAP